ncbi:hypothetical protein LTR56_004472 [Elasticomyces elasticus]|nr:hypothetical protein LTR56_004472 [Elasticomyces elasticus]KAK3654205.1 hypothetical protein LTR22_010831 [Elasticomyces elasticus]KAK4920021.1 hypothetical protein LTR49_012459 [Elasticomyces elasticus]KAK5758855.1 hypothetical protein LTS12_011096 [Elasticomyces elasticus]
MTSATPPNVPYPTVNFYQQPVPPLQQPVADDEWPEEVTAYNNDVYQHLGEDWKNDRPWQYSGYPAWARHQASQHDFFVLRRFAPTQVRCLLYLQNEIGKLERKLNAWDNYVTKLPTGEGYNATMSNDEWPQRNAIIRKLLPLLHEYSEQIWQSNFSAVTDQI